MRNWKTLESHTVFRNRWFDIKEEKVQITDDLTIEGIIIHNFSDWVNVVAFTDKGQVLLEKQYRHGLGVITIETPSGAMKAHDKMPSDGALRELLEETGYRPEKMIQTGRTQANPQLQNNFIHHFIALGCKKVALPEPMLGDEIEVWSEPFDTVIEKVRRGDISHGYTVEGLLRAKDWLEQNPGEL
jgi:ADP-ribose pyrophosphatase